MLKDSGSEIVSWAPPDINVEAEEKNKDATLKGWRYIET